MLFREGLGMTVQAVFPNSHISYAGSWTEVHQHAENKLYDMMLLDICMPRNLAWEEELRIIMQNNPQSIICIISATLKKSFVKLTYNLGVKGYICKTIEPNKMKKALLGMSMGETCFPPQIDLDNSVYDNFAH
ncbi:MAG: response regulator, partial [Mariprofundaceae bacterium]|nr:response regulator [Mariprofundaceae bacterium]